MEFREWMDSPTHLFGLPVVLVAELALVILLGLSIAFARFALGQLLPIKKWKWQLTRSDVICLIAMILPCLASLHLPALLAGNDWREPVPLDFLCLTLVGTGWFLGIGSASTVGIQKPWHRAAAIMLIYPLNTFGPLLISIVFAFSIADHLSTSTGIAPSVHMAFVVIGVLVIAAMVASARLARSIGAAIERTRND